MKVKKVSNLLLRDYVILYFISTIIFIVSIIITISLGLFSFVNINPPEISLSDMMKDDYTQISIAEITKLNGWIEIVDSNLNVIYTKGKVQIKRDKYTKEQYFSMLTDEGEFKKLDKNYSCQVAYNAKKDFMLIAIIPMHIKDKFDSDISKKIGGSMEFGARFYFATLIISTIIFAKMTSKDFVTPLKRLIEGVRNLAIGDYSTRIELTSKNEFGELKDAINHMAERIEKERKLKEKSEENRRNLIRDISHDLKNPLASVMGYSDFLLKNQNLPHDERIKFLNIIHRNSIRANGLIGDLFELSKFESPDFALTLKSRDICEFLRELLAAYIPELEEKGFEYDFEIPDKEILIAFDSENMDRAISNLITNFMKYNPMNTKLCIFLKQNFDFVDIIVQDNGIGISKQLAKEIFEPFVRVDTARNSKKGGTGLGLAITKTIIEKHKGTISLISDTNQGCKFIIKLKI